MQSITVAMRRCVSRLADEARDARAVIPVLTLCNELHAPSVENRALPARLERLRRQDDILASQEESYRRRLAAAQVSSRVLCWQHRQLGNSIYCTPLVDRRSSPLEHCTCCDSPMYPFGGSAPASSSCRRSVTAARPLWAT